MSDEGEKTCPLCAEEMDLTDQQLKPCKCGYEICVWCWHHIMEMAEKDNIEGRCPACRSPYNKEKIVGMAAKCERLVAEMSMEKKVKSKSKSKTPDGRKQLSSVRVIQRNLVYIVGLPLSLADEDLLQQKEYFAQYGKVLKVSISRTAAGTIQHFANNTCSVYITYSKEEEAIRCIQSVHGFTLEGRPLRACFGTTKYCHAWLRNVPCSNPDCLYLHEIGTQEDSFSKDEIISAYTRSRVQQITGATIDMQRRSGNVLPPPADEFCNNSYTSSGTTISKSATNDIDICSDNILGSSVWQTPASSVRGSPPNSSSGRSVGLPAAASWGMRASNSQPQSACMASSNGPSKQKSETCSASLAFSTAVASPAQVSILHGNSGKKRDEEVCTTTQKSKLEPVESVKLYMDADHRRTPSDTSTMIGHSVSSVINSQLSTPPLKDKDESVNVPANLMKSFDLTEQSCGIGPEKGRNVAVEGKVQNLCSDMSSLNIDRQGLNRRDTEQYREPLTSHAPAKAAASSKGSSVPRDQSESRLDSQAQVAERATREVEDDLVSFDVQRLEDPEVVSHTSYLPSLSQSFRQSDSSRVFFPQQAYGSLNVNVDPLIVDKKLDKGSLPQEYSIPVISNGYSDNRPRSFTDLDTSANHSYMLPNEGKMKHVGRHEGEMVKNDGIAANDMGESSIISNILSMDFDSWDESLASPQNLAKLLGETDKQQGSLGVSSSWKVQNSNQSRFSFAREEDQVSNFEPSFSNFGQATRNHSFGNGFVNNRDFFLDNAGNSNGFSTFSAEEPGNFASIHSHYSSNKFSVSRAQVSVPPGFSGPSRAPPPGFTPHERMEQIFDIHSGNNFLDNSSLSRKPYQAPPAMNIGTTTADIEFMDPAILAVGKGRLPGGLNSPGLDMRSTFPPQMSTYENEARLQLLMQRSLSPHQNQRYVEMGDNFSSRPDGYGMPTRIMDQTVNNNLSPFSQFNLPQSRSQLMSNGNWDGWSEVQRGNDLSMSELLRAERLEINKFFNGYEDSKFRMPSSGDIYNRTYGI